MGESGDKGVEKYVYSVRKVYKICGKVCGKAVENMWTKSQHNMVVLERLK